MLQDSEGNWVGDQDGLETMVTNYYKDLFTEEESREPTCILGAFPSLSAQEVDDISRNVSKCDIFNVVRHMGAFKAPGPDGL